MSGRGKQKEEEPEKKVPVMLIRADYMTGQKSRTFKGMKTLKERKQTKKKQHKTKKGDGDVRKCVPKYVNVTFCFIV